jgi:hypothetical protein
MKSSCCEVAVFLFTGWFSLLTPRGQLMAPCYSSIQQLIAAQVTRFLTKTQLTAYKLNDSKGNNKFFVMLQARQSCNLSRRGHSSVT